MKHNARTVGLWVCDVLVVIVALAATSQALTKRQNQSTCAWQFGFGPGDIIPLDFAWSHASGTVVLALRTTCPACNKSAAFMARLADACRRAVDCKSWAVGLETETIIREWLSAHEIVVDHVTSLPKHAKIGLHVTPTFAVLDATGIITTLDVGVPSPADEQQLVNRVEGRRDMPSVGNEPRPALLIGDEQYARFSARTGSNVVDLRERMDYWISHRKGAVSIPLEELELRAPNELEAHEPVAVDCMQVPGMRCYEAVQTLFQAGFNDVSVVVSHGAQCR